MILYPAIDILGGRAVRLERGDFAHSTEYDADPVDAAERWVAAGARALHVVDLDGARTGAPVHVDEVARIVAAVEIPVQVGGGMREPAAVEAVLAAGATRVILGTAALRDVDFLDAVLDAHRDRVVVSLDARGGLLAAAGWTEQTDVPVAQAVAHLGDRGVRTFVYSSIDRDGIMTGPDLDGAREFSEAARGTFVYSGGISALADLESLATLRAVNLTGVIVGRALYDRRFDVGEAQKLLDQLR